MGERIHLSNEAHIEKSKLISLIFGYSLVCNQILPNDMLHIIRSYIPIRLWLKCGTYLQILNDSMVSCNIYHEGRNSTAYSMNSTDILYKNKYKFIWNVKIVEMHRKNNNYTDIRIGIASTMDIMDEGFTNSIFGHNYSYISWKSGTNIASHIGYNGSWKKISNEYVYSEGDVITVEVNLCDKQVSYFKNNKFIAMQEDIVEENYRLAVNIMGQPGKLQIIYFKTQLLNE
eukprot:378402_1